MTSSDLFDGDRDQRILSAWLGGSNLEEIGHAFGITEWRAAHEINRLLNERNGFKAKARYAE